MKFKSHGLDVSMTLLGCVLLIVAVVLAQDSLTLRFFLYGGVQRRIAIFQVVFFAYGLLALGVGLWGLSGSARGGSSFTELAYLFIEALPGWIAQKWKSFIDFNHQIPLNVWAWFVPQLFIGCMLVVYFSSQPMRGDEAYTFLNYVNGNFLNVFLYSAPNNHVLYTLLTKFFVSLFGAEPFVIRLAAFLAGMFNILLMFYFCRLCAMDYDTGVFSALGMAVFPYLVLYATNARGYTLLIFLFLLTAITGVHILRNFSRISVMIFALLAALGLLIMPSAIMAIAGIFVWVAMGLFLKKYPVILILQNLAGVFIGYSAFFSFIFYTPVILASNGIEPIIANKFVKRLVWSEFISGIIPQFQNAFIEMTREIHPVVITLGVIFFLVGLFIAFKNGNTKLAFLAPSIFLGTLSVLLFTLAIPYARTLIYLIPVFLITMDYGIAAILNMLPNLGRVAIKLLVLAAGTIFAISLISNNVIGRYLDTSAFPEAEMVVKYLKPIIKEGDSIHVTNTANVPIEFYLWYYGLPERDFSTRLETGRNFYVVKKSHYSIQDMTNKPVMLLLDFGNMSLYERIKE